MTTSSPEPTAETKGGLQIAMIVNVDPGLIDAAGPSGIVEAQHNDASEIITLILGEVAEIVPMDELKDRLRTVMQPATIPMPVPMSPTIPVNNEKTRAYSRRRLALEHAMAIADRSRVAHLGTDASTIVRDAEEFEAYLNGQSAEGNE